MGRPVILSNGHILVGLDENGLVHDFYFPYVGLDNLASARVPVHKIGVWVEGKLSWLDDDSWQVKTNFEDRALVSDIEAESKDLQVKLRFQDFVDNHYPVLARKIEIINNADTKRDIRLFMHQAFQISRSGRSDTALYVPTGPYILDYKGWASLLIYARNEDSGKDFDQFAVGNWGIEGKEGTYRDADDGQLSGSLVEHGGVDSTLGLNFEIEANASAKASYWVIASTSQFDAEAIHKVMLNKGIDSRLESTRQSFNEWLSKSDAKIANLDDKYKAIATKSLLIVKSHIDKHGGIIASCDSSIYNYGRDYYSYVWPRDGAFTLLPLIELGYQEEPKKFFEFCADTMHPGGYMMHKYQPDRAVGSTWHPQMHKNHPELPIQEDETAIVLYALGRYLKVSNDVDFVRSCYDHLVVPAANFMSSFIDSQTNLPHSSYDLWEERFATHTYTVSTVLAGLKAAMNIAGKLGQAYPADWQEAFDRISQGFKLLYDQENGCFRKSILLESNGDLNYDNTLDVSSMYGVFLFGGADEELLANCVGAIEDRLLDKSPSGGAPRYEHDNYFLTKHQYLGNPWMITTLWLAQHYFKHSRRERAIELIDWVIDKASDSGILAEQVDPETSAPTGVSPLVWSHSTLVETLLML
jgi:GH15 family glucan-1,4-alpha-glucosidase